MTTTTATATSRSGATTTRHGSQSSHHGHGGGGGGPLSRSNTRQQLRLGVTTDYVDLSLHSACANGNIGELNRVSFCLLVNANKQLLFSLLFRHCNSVEADLELQVKLSPLVPNTPDGVPSDLMVTVSSFAIYQC
jgi:hypothetical protein